MFIYCWEENDHVSSAVFFPIGCRSRKSLFICIKLKDSELCCVAGHAPSGRQRSLLLAVAHVAGNRQLSIEINGIVSLCRWVSLVVWTGLNGLAGKCYIATKLGFTPFEPIHLNNQTIHGFVFCLAGWSWNFHEFNNICFFSQILSCRNELYVLLLSRSPVKAQCPIWTGEIIIKHDLVTTFL